MKKRAASIAMVVTGCVIAVLVAYQVSMTAAVVKITPQDYMEIQQLYAKYYQSYDSGDPDAWASVFTPDGNFNGTKGTEALKNVIRNGPAKGTNVRHWMSNLLLIPIDDAVQAKVYVLQFDTRAQPITAITYSRYDDLLVKVNNTWLFKEKLRSTDTSMGGGRGGGGRRGAAPADGNTTTPPTGR